MILFLYMPAFIYILGSVFIISILSLIGVLSLSIGRQRLHSFLTVFVAFASGTLLSAAFLHMMPEAYHEIGDTTPSIVLAGIILFFFIEKYIHWHHCGKEECKVRPVAYLNLIGDGFHNFIDGVIIAAAYLTSIRIGLVTTIAIALHEIPQEFGDFSILLHSGMSTRKALAYNFLSATTAILGALTGFIFLSNIQEWIPSTVAVAAGGFIYIATADLMPELHKETSKTKLLTQSIALLAGVIILAAAFQLTPHEDVHGHETEVFEESGQGLEIESVHMESGLLEPVIEGAWICPCL
jgi:zinc and cadmium transporter